MTRARRQTVLLLTGDDATRARVSAVLVRRGHRVESATTREAAHAAADRNNATVAVYDLAFAEALGEDFLRRLKNSLPLTTPILVLHGRSEDDIRVAMREGAYQCLGAEWDDLLFDQIVQNALEKNALVEENVTLRNELRRSKSLIMKDDLTSSYNRRYFDTFLEEEIDRSRRFGSPLSLIFMDLDNLKQVNSRYGHAMGSLALKEAAVRIIETVRSIDKVVRYGGDEFCIILPETDWRGAQEVAERVRGKFAQGPFLLGKTEGVVLTASFGIASCPTHADNKNDLVRKADEAMFQIKQTRKNGILVASA